MSTQKHLLTRLINMIVAVSFITTVVSVAGCGKQEFSRSQAEKLIFAFAQKKAPYLFCPYSYDRTNAMYYSAKYNDPKELQSHQKLEQNGYLSIVQAKPQISLFGMTAGPTWGVRFNTDKISPFLAGKPLEVGKEVIIVCAELSKIEVTGITEPADDNGVKKRLADFRFSYEATPYGISSSGATPDRLSGEAQVSFKLYDDGWRLEE